VFVVYQRSWSAGKVRATRKRDVWAVTVLKKDGFANAKAIFGGGVSLWRAGKVRRGWGCTLRGSGSCELRR